MQLECRTCTQAAGGDVHLCGRVVTVFESGGKPLPEPVDRCACCSGDATGKVTVPTDQKLWLMADVEPQQYETDQASGKKVMKDWAQGDLDARIGREDPDDLAEIEAAKERKRDHARNGRRRPLASWEVAKVDEAVRDGIMAADADAAGLSLVREKRKETGPLLLP